MLSNLRKIDLDPEPEYEFDVTKPDGIGKASVYCKSIEHVTDQRKRRNSIARAAGNAVGNNKSSRRSNCFRGFVWNTDSNTSTSRYIT